jgi:hypothetical protein
MCPEAFSQLYQTQIKGQQDYICSPDNPYRSLVPEPIVPKEPGIEYYSFLDSLGFGSPDFLYASIAFREDHSPIHTFMKSVLDIKEFGLKPISDTTPEEWMEHARKSLGRVKDSKTTPSSTFCSQQHMCDRYATAYRH